MIIERDAISRESATIRQALATDAEAIARLYNPFITDSIITFEEQPVAPAEMASRIAEVAAASLPWSVATRAGSVVGYAYASKWKGRSAYRFSVETAVYVDPACARQGIGTSLYRALLDQLKQRGLHAAFGVIALPNPPSVGLHAKLGFRLVGQLAEAGFKFGQWIDVGYWQLIL